MLASHGAARPTRWDFASVLDSEGDLAAAGAAEAGAASLGDLTELRTGDIEVGIPEVEVIQYVGESALSAQMQIAVKHKGLEETGRPVDGSRTFKRADLSIAEAPDGSNSDEISVGVLRDAADVTRLSPLP